MSTGVRMKEKPGHEEESPLWPSASSSGPKSRSLSRRAPQEGLQDWGSWGESPRASGRE